MSQKMSLTARKKPLFNRKSPDLSSFCSLSFIMSQLKSPLLDGHIRCKSEQNNSKVYKVLNFA